MVALRAVSSTRKLQAARAGRACFDFGLWKVLRLVPGGDGFARLPDGRVGFATGALPGDVIRPDRVTMHRSYLRAQGWELIEPGPDRVPAPCPEAGRCGGCNWMHLERSAQLRAKAGLVREALIRTGKFKHLSDGPEVVASGPNLRYRSNLRLHVGERGRVGLFARCSREVVPIDDCLVGPHESRHILETLRAQGAGQPDALSAFSEVTLRVAPTGPPLALHLLPREPNRRLAPAGRVLARELAKTLAVCVAGASAGHPDQGWPLSDGLTLLSPPGGFTQANWEVNRELVRAIVEGARERGVKRFCDLYCGSGNFTLPLLQAGLQGMGIERHAPSVKSAQRAARKAGLDHHAVRRGDAVHIAHQLASERAQFDLVLLDPPRGGARNATAELLRLAPRFIALCGCEPVTWARDLRTLASGGYALQQLCAFDMFPHTHHLEVLAWLRSTSAG